MLCVKYLNKSGEKNTTKYPQFTETLTEDTKREGTLSSYSLKTAWPWPKPYQDSTRNHNYANLSKLDLVMYKLSISQKCKFNIKNKQVKGGNFMTILLQAENFWKKY